MVIKVLGNYLLIDIIWSLIFLQSENSTGCQSYMELYAYTMDLRLLKESLWSVNKLCGKGTYLFVLICWQYDCDGVCVPLTTSMTC